MRFWIAMSLVVVSSVLLPGVRSGEKKQTTKDEKERVASARRGGQDNKGPQGKTVTPAELKLLELKHDGGVWFVTFSANGTSVVTASSDDTVRIWNSSDGKQVHRWNLPDYRFFAGSAASINSGGTHFAAYSFKEKAVRAWTIKTGEKTFDAPQKEPVSQLLFNSDGSLLAIVTNDNISIVNTKTGKEAVGFKAPQRLWSMAFSPDNKVMATASLDGGFGKGKHSINTWDLTNGKETLSLSYKADGGFASNGLVFSPDGKRFIVATALVGTKVYDVATGKGHDIHDLPVKFSVSSLAFTADGKRLVVGSQDRVKVLNAETWKEEYITNLHRGPVCVAVSPTSHIFATGSFDKTANIMRVPTETERLAKEREVTSEELKKLNLEEIKKVLGDATEIHQTKRQTVKMLTWKRDTGYVVLLVLDNGTTSVVLSSHTERTWADVERLKKAAEK